MANIEKLSRPLPLFVQGDLGLTAGEIWNLDTREMVFWCHEDFTPGFEARCRIDLGRRGEAVDAVLRVEERLEGRGHGLRRGYLFRARFVLLGTEALAPFLDRLGELAPDALHGPPPRVKSRPSGTPTIHLPPAQPPPPRPEERSPPRRAERTPRRAERTPRLAERTPGARPSERPRGRETPRAVPRGAEKPRTEVGEARRPAPPEDARAAVTRRSGGLGHPVLDRSLEPAALQLSFADERELRRALPWLEKRPVVEVAAVEGLEKGLRLLLVISLPGGGVLQFPSRVLRADERRASLSLRQAGPALRVLAQAARLPPPEP